MVLFLLTYSNIYHLFSIEEFSTIDQIVIRKIELLLKNPKLPNSLEDWHLLWGNQVIVL